jgi:hypothetical protein
MRPRSRLGDWITTTVLLVIGLLANVIGAALGLSILESLGLWPILESNLPIDLGDARSR